LRRDPPDADLFYAPDTRGLLAPGFVPFIRVRDGALTLAYGKRGGIVIAHAPLAVLEPRQRMPGLMLDVFVKPHEMLAMSKLAEWLDQHGIPHLREDHGS